MNDIDTVKTLITALQSGDLELAANTMTDDFKFSGLSPRPLTLREFLVMQSHLLSSMPDFSYNLSQLHQEGDEVVAQIQITGVQSGDLTLPEVGLQEIPATGLAVDLSTAPARFKVVEGKVQMMQLQPSTGGGLPALIQQAATELPVTEREENFSA